ncbi:MAG: adenylate/guanylate cyclase domain-containing protein [Chloroflexi bacterium]|nr:adenylate/guanylate cyclase domain-containing protein [Chloroflexota bacterium]
MTFTPTLAARIASIGIDPADPPDLRFRKNLLVAAILSIVILATAWVVIYALLGLTAAAAIPGGYCLVSLGQIAVFARSRRFEPFLRTQLALMIGLPMALQLVVGGFENSSAVVIWSFVGALAAIFFAERTPHRWFAAFVVGLLVVTALAPVVAPGATPIPQPIRLAFFALNVLAVALLAWGVTMYVVRARARAMAALDAEHARSEALLLNVLPAPIAERLKAGESVIADAYDEATILFADVAGFTPFAARTPPREVIGLLNDLFSAFDDLADRHGLEKIKTIGDAYMVVGGLPEPRPDHAEAVGAMALEMLDAGRGLAQHGLALRLGMDLGPVTAGGIGRRKFAFDLWGDAVNMASRMEAQGVPGRIQVTPAVQARLRSRFEFEPRGPLEVKGRGVIEPYFLVGRTGTAGPTGSLASAVRV